ncbi:MAG TPA: DUF1801 domain-containing protein [Burkholderiaceae bacterium]|jgi:hypothetical protein|nr:DUF1801 domain-containing protein [Burkholderiaceae bacterium]
MRTLIRPAALIQAHLDTLPTEAREQVEALRSAVLAAAPQLAQAVQWGNLVFQHGGRNAIAIVVHRGHVNLQFFNGAAFAVQFPALEGKGRAMRHLRFRMNEPVAPTVVASLVQACLESME